VALCRKGMSGTIVGLDDVDVKLGNCVIMDTSEVGE